MTERTLDEAREKMNSDTSPQIIDLSKNWDDEKPENAFVDDLSIGDEIVLGNGDQLEVVGWSDETHPIVQEDNGEERVIHPEQVSDIEFKRRPDEHRSGPFFNGISLRLEEDELWCPEVNEVVENEDPCPGCNSSVTKNSEIVWTNVGGDPFQDYQTLEEFCEALEDEGASVLLGNEPWEEATGHHDRPVRAFGIALEDAEDVWEEYEDDALAIGGPKSKQEEDFWRKPIVFVDNVSEAPEDAVVHATPGDETQLYYVDQEAAKELPMTCRVCGIRTRTYNTFRCPKCHSEMSEDEHPPLASEPHPSQKSGDRSQTEKQSGETYSFDSSKLIEGIYDADEQELWLSFKRQEPNQRAVYVYQNVPESEWEALKNASSPGRYHYNNIRLEYPYEEVTDFYNRIQLSEKDWVPYQGPQGGEGWQNTETGQVVYDDEPPISDDQEVGDLSEIDDVRVVADIEDPEELTSMVSSYDESITDLSAKLAQTEEWHERDKIKEQIDTVQDARQMATEQMKNVANNAEAPGDVKELIDYQDEHYEIVHNLESREQEIWDQVFEAHEDGNDAAAEQLRDQYEQLSSIRNEIENNLAEVKGLRNLAESSMTSGEFEYKNSQELREQMHEASAAKRQATQQKQQLERIIRERRRELREQADSFDEYEELQEEEVQPVVEERLRPAKQREEELKTQFTDASQKLDELREEWFVNEVKEGAREFDEVVNVSDEPAELSTLGPGYDPDDEVTVLDEAWNNWFSSPSEETKQELVSKLKTEEAQRRVLDHLADAGLGDQDSVTVYRGGEINPDRGYDSWSTSLDEAESFARWEHGSVDTENNMAHGLAMMASGEADKDVQELADQIHVTEVPKEHILGYDSREQEVIISPEPIDRSDLRKHKPKVINLDSSPTLRVPDPDQTEKMGFAYPDAGSDDAPPKVQEAVQRFREEVPKSTKREQPLLYWLLGTGTPEYKMSEADADLQTHPKGDQSCGNCKYLYRANDGGFICSQVRGPMAPDYWCRFWETEEGEAIFMKEWVSDPTEQAPNRWTNTETGEHRYQETKPGEDDTENLAEELVDELGEEDAEQVLSIAETEEAVRDRLEIASDDSLELGTPDYRELDEGQTLWHPEAGTVTVEEVYQDPMAGMGPNEGYVRLSDGSYANLMGDDMDEIPDDATVRRLGDADAVYESSGSDELPNASETENPVDELVSSFPDMTRQGADIEELVEPVKEAATKGYSGEAVIEAMNSVGADEGYQKTQLSMEMLEDAFTAEYNGTEVGGYTPTKEGNQVLKAKNMISEFDPEVQNTMTHALDRWSMSSTDADTRLLWEYARQQTGNENIPVIRDSLSDEEKEAIEEIHDETTEILREAHGDTVTVYRGVKNDFGGRVKRRAKEALTGDGEVDVTHRTIGSWTTNPVSARSFSGRSGIMFKQEVPVEDILVSHVSGAGLTNESEMVVMSEEETTYDAADDLLIEDQLELDQIMDEFLDQYRDEFDQ